MTLACNFSSSIRECASTLQPEPLGCDPICEASWKEDEDVELHFSNPSAQRRSEETSASIGNRLEMIKRAGWRRRWWVSAPCISLGVALLIVGVGLIASSDKRGFEPSMHLGSLCSQVGACACLLSVLPTDARSIRFFYVMGLIIHVLSIIPPFRYVGERLTNHQSSRCHVFDAAGEENPSPCWLEALKLAAEIVKLIRAWCVSIFLVRFAFAHHSAVLRMLWLVSGVTFIVSGLIALCIGVATIFVGPGTHGLFFELLSYLVFCSGICLGIFCCRERYRIRVQSWLASRGDAAVAAAGISELLQGQDVQEILEKARNAFLCVSGDKVLKNDMADSHPNARLQDLTEKAHYGHVDAFISHSWHDDAEAKWAEFQRWRQEFKAAHHREPRVWMDKYCIDQNNIRDSLACLPVYLSGCRKLLILRGATYTQRLWCAMELFIFLEMGASLEGIIVRNLVKNQADFDDLRKQALEFNVRQATCHLKEDAERLISVIDAGLSRGVELEETVRTIFGMSSFDE